MLPKNDNKYVSNVHTVSSQLNHSRWHSPGGSTGSCQ